MSTKAEGKRVAEVDFCRSEAIPSDQHAVSKAYDFYQVSLAVGEHALVNVMRTEYSQEKK